MATNKENIEVEQVEVVSEKSSHNDTEERVIVTPEDNRRILRKTDLHLLTILTWVYWLQILDKSVLGYAATFGLKTDAHLVGNQYSTVGSMNAIAQLAWQPFSSYVLVRVKPRYFMPFIVCAWGASLCGMGGSKSFAPLAATRFLLGLFEAAILPLMAIITSVWYRRAEQPMRVAIWQGTNGLGTIMAAIFSYGFGHIKNPALHTYQIIFIFCGGLTVVTTPFIYWKIQNQVSEANFLSSEDRKKAVERLRANNTGNNPNDSFKWGQVLEAALEIKTWLFLFITVLLNVGASVSNVFGPVIISGLGFDKFRATLLNIPFGALQLIVVVSACYGAYSFKGKGLIISILVLPVIVGLVLLYGECLPGLFPPHSHLNSNIVHDLPLGVLLFGYYLLAAVYGANPLIISWITANTAGSTKRSVMLALYNGGSAVGNIIGPFLFKEVDAPLYLPGLKAVLGIFVALFVCVWLQIFNLMWLNKRKENERVKNGKPAKLHDASMDNTFKTAETTAEGLADARGHLGDNAFKDLTDKENDEFIYVY